MNIIFNPNMISLSLAIGIAAGTLSGIFGIGGGIIIVPALVYLLNIPQTTASIVSLMSMLLPVGLWGVWEFYRSGRIQPEMIKVSALITIGLIIGVYFGAKFMTRYVLTGSDAETILRRGFALLMVISAIRFWKQN